MKISRPKIYYSVLCLCIVGAVTRAQGQEAVNCSPQAYDEAETSYRARSSHGSEMKERTERELRALVQSCAATPERDKAQAQLQIVQEELAELNLQVAKFYLEKSWVNGGRALGARARLKNIFERYPKYTKMDEVLSLLGQLYIDAGEREEAATCYRKLINDCPNSQYANAAAVQVSQAVHASALDVIHYDVTLEPDIAAKSVKGTVRVRFVTNASEAEFNCGELAIDSVRFNNAAVKFSVIDHRVKISLPPKAREIEIDFHGTPKYGIQFFPDRQQVYTVFSTSQWMVCIDDPSDKATLTFKLILPANLTPIANGKLVSQHELPNNRRVTEWEQRSAIPTYIFGFAAGPFQVVKSKRGNVEFQYFSTKYSQDEVRRIFRDTPDMLDFFETHAGVKYADRTYTQVLAAGRVEQEMSSFTALRETYGKQVLDNEQDTWLAAHELAHQWWGNMVTCRDWNHFWLNEGIASFIAAAYLEHRFGRAAYMREIETYRVNYEKVKAAGKDKSLVFPDWLHPTREDRTLVYDKGAYVLHLLREEMGERAFWNGLKLFTQRNFGKSVVTSDFTAAMEEANGKSLQDFFAKWVYLRAG